MKRRKEPALIEIQRRGLDALSRELGPDGLIRFFQIYGLGVGDYTRDRHKWLSKTSVDEISAKIGIKKKRT
jgi:hypothetical protein